jgi:hypothetical protein
MNTQLYDLNGEWVNLERYRKAKGIRQSIEPEPEVIEIKEDKVEIITENYAKETGNETKKRGKEKRSK